MERTALPYPAETGVPAAGSPGHLALRSALYFGAGFLPISAASPLDSEPLQLMWSCLPLNSE